MNEKAGMAPYPGVLENNKTAATLSNTALELMIVEARRNGDVPGAILFAEKALGQLQGEQKAGVMFNLVFSYLQNDNIDAARLLTDQFKQEFPDNVAESEMLESSIATAPVTLQKKGAAKPQAAGKRLALTFQGPSETATLPRSVQLVQNHPNPFNPETRIKYQITEAAAVTITIYNLVGQQITTLVNEPKGAGFFSVMWDGRDAAGAQVGSGVYIYRFAVRPAKSSSRPFVRSKKMVLVR